MTILDVSLAWSKVGGSGLKTSGGKITAGFTDGYQVTHTYDATDIEIMTATGLPSLGTYRSGTTIPCVGISPPQRVGPIFSIVTVEFSAEFSFEPGDTPDSATNKNPLLQPAEIQFDSETSSTPIDKDWNGNVIATFNAEPINGVSRDVTDTVLVVTKNFPTWNPNIIENYYEASNSDVFTSFGFEPGRVRLRSCPATRVLDETFGFYWRATARFTIRKQYATTADKAWYSRVAHQGFKVRLTPGGEVQHAQRKNQDVVTPVNISTTTGVDLGDDPADTQWKEFQLYGSLPYNALGFGI